MFPGKDRLCTMASNVRSQQDFERTFPDASVEAAAIDPAIRSTEPRFTGPLLDHAVVIEWLSGDLGVQLHTCRKMLIQSHEHSRYMLIYEVLKTFVKYSSGRLLVKVNTNLEPHEDSGLLPDSELEVGFEHTIKGSGAKARIEFIIFDKKARTALLSIEVKPSIYSTEDVWQTLAELMILAGHNDTDSHSCMTDGFEWRFFRAQKKEGRWCISGSRPLSMFDSALYTKKVDTVLGFSVLFSVLFPQQQLPSKQQLISTQKAFELDMKQQAAASIEAIVQEATDMENLKQVAETNSKRLKMAR